MLIPVAIVIIVIFIAIALYIIFRKSNGKIEKRNQEVSGNEKKIIKSNL